MNAEYEIFECRQDGSINSRQSAPDLTTTRALLQELAKLSTNDHFGFCLTTRELVFRADSSRKVSVIAKRVFEIAYTEKLMRERADLLRSIGYGVLSVIGHAGSQSTRTEMVDWLRARYPSVRIIALNPPNEHIPAADYNVLQNGPESWLPIVNRSVDSP